MRKVVSKALYLFLCAILGMILFAMLHRAIFVLYSILLSVDNIYALGLSAAGITAIDFFTLLIALFLGGWYGTMLGIDWYAMVYGPNAEHPAGLFHGFLPHHWRGQRGATGRSNSSNSATQPASAKVATKVKVASASAPTTTTTVVKVPVQEPIKPIVREWSFDDLITPKPIAKKPLARKSVTKKSPRKPAVKK